MIYDAMSEILIIKPSDVTSVSLFYEAYIANVE